MKESAKIFALKTFKGRDKETQYYVADCLLDSAQSSQNFKGLSSVNVFIERPVFDTFFRDFKPMMPCELNVSISGNRVNYSLLI